MQRPRGACGRRSLPAEATLKLKVEDRGGASQVKRAMRGVWPEEGMAPEKLEGGGRAGRTRGF